MICDATATSPCTGVCELDPASGFCRGCLRTLQEIARWGGLSLSERRMVKSTLAERRCAIAAERPILVSGA